MPMSTTTRRSCSRCWPRTRAGRCRRTRCRSRAGADVRGVAGGRLRHRRVRRAALRGDARHGQPAVGVYGGARARRTIGHWRSTCCAWPTAWSPRSSPSSPASSPRWVSRRPRADTGRGGCAGPPEQLLADQRRVVQAGRACCSSTPGARQRNGLPRERLRELGQPVVAGFSTHPHWDHLLWHASLGTAPVRHGALRGHRPRSAVRRGREGPRRRMSRRTSSSRYRWSCSASLPACPPTRHGFPGMARGSGSSSIKRTPRATRRC